MWLAFLSLLVVVNVLVGFLSKERGPELLSLWMAASFVVSLLIEKPHWLSPPGLMFALAVLDTVMTRQMAVVCRRNQELSIAFWPVALTNLTFISVHFTAIFRSDFHAYLATLDVLFILQLVVNFTVSVRGGLDIHNLWPSRRRPAYSGVNHNSEGGR